MALPPATYGITIHSTASERKAARRGSTLGWRCWRMIMASCITMSCSSHTPSQNSAAASVGLFDNKMFRDHGLSHCCVLQLTQAQSSTIRTVLAEDCVSYTRSQNSADAWSWLHQSRQCWRNIIAACITRYCKFNTLIQNMTPRTGLAHDQGLMRGCVRVTHTQVRAGLTILAGCEACCQQCMQAHTTGCGL